jgi:hypothetical protein
MRISTECTDAIASIKKGSEQGIFEISNEGLSVLKIKHRNRNSVADCNEFIEELPPNKCCHIFSHFPYCSTADSTNREKFVHILWAPRDATQKDKMILSFFAQQVLSELGALGAARIEAGSVCDLDYNEVREKILRRVTVK